MYEIDAGENIGKKQGKNYFFAKKNQDYLKKVALLTMTAKRDRFWRDLGPLDSVAPLRFINNLGNHLMPLNLQILKNGILCLKFIETCPKSVFLKFIPFLQKQQIHLILAAIFNPIVVIGPISKDQFIFTFNLSFLPFPAMTRPSANRRFFSHDKSLVIICYWNCSLQISIQAFGYRFHFHLLVSKQIQQNINPEIQTTDFIYKVITQCHLSYSQ